MSFTESLRSRFQMFFKDWRSTFVFLIFMALARVCLADHYYVPSGSMLPTLQLGDHIFVNKMAYDLKFPLTDVVLVKESDPQRGDVVVFRYPVDETQTFVKRVIGIPGDEVELRDGRVFVNGVAEKISNRTLGENGPLTARTFWKVPAGHFFVMGDNRGNSLDSRAWGFVAREQIKGKAEAALWNLAPGTFPPRVSVARFGTVYRYE